MKNKLFAIIIGVIMIFSFTTLIARGAETPIAPDGTELVSATVTKTVTVTRAETWYIKNVGTKNRLYFVYGEDEQPGYIDVDSFTYAKVKDGDTMEVWCFVDEFAKSYGSWKTFSTPQTDMYVTALFKTADGSKAYAELSDGRFVQISTTESPRLMQDVELKKNGTLKGYGLGVDKVNKGLSTIGIILMFAVAVALAALILVPLGAFVFEAISSAIENHRDRKSSSSSSYSYDDWYGY